MATKTTTRIQVISYIRPMLKEKLEAARERASKRAGARRVRERTLHLWAVAGGFGGALLGQAWLRHKTRHPSFLIITLLAVIAHGGAWAWWWGGR